MPKKIMQGSLAYRIARLPKARFVYGWLMLLLGRSGLSQSGWFKSIWRGQSVNRQGQPIPWITYDSIAFLESRLPTTKKLRVFEYGSGNSSLWWAKYAKQLIAIEYDQQWQELISAQAPANIEVKYVPLDGDYANAISKEAGDFDVVVIDGRQRNDCAKNAINKLSKDGIILWDNSNRDKYRAGMEWLIKQGFRQVDFIGMAPLGPKNSQTSIFYRDNNLLNI